MKGGYILKSERIIKSEQCDKKRILSRDFWCAQINRKIRIERALENIKERRREFKKETEKAFRNLVKNLEEYENDYGSGVEES